MDVKKFLDACGVGVSISPIFNSPRTNFLALLKQISDFENPENSANTGILLGDRAWFLFGDQSLTSDNVPTIFVANEILL